MTDALLIIAGLVEFVLRFVFVLAICITLFGLIILAEYADGNGGVGSYLEPICWQMFAERDAR